MSNSTDWQSAAQSYLARLGMAEYRSAMAQHCKRRKASTYRHNPSEYHRSLVEALGLNDEELFKAIKAEQGYSSKVGV